MKLIARLLISVALILPVLAACGAVPQPFKGSANVSYDNPLLDVPAATGVAILQVTGLPPDLSDQLARAIANQLQAMEIPAAPMSRAGGLGFIVNGHAGPITETASGKNFDVSWTVKSRHGTVVGRFVQTVVIAPGEGGVVASAVNTARSIASTMGLDPNATQVYAGPGPSRPTLPSISVKPLAEAPGDGEESLLLAVVQALSAAGATRNDVDPDVTLYVQMESVPAGLDSQDVTISWRAVARGGRGLGTVRVRNAIPNGTLDRPWGRTAFAIAAGAQHNLVRLISATPAP